MAKSECRKKDILCTFTFWLLLVSLLASGSSQVTMSKGWGPGKRSAYPEEICGMEVKSVIGICHSLLGKLHQLVVCESKLLATYGQAEDELSQNIYN